MTLKFRTPETNKPILKSLFLETAPSHLKGFVLYTLHDKDRLLENPIGQLNSCRIPSLFRLYLQEADQTEFTFANKYLESYDHWNDLCQCSWFKPVINKWRQALELQVKSLALRNIKEIAEDKKHSKHFEAAKYLLDKGYHKEKKLHKEAIIAAEEQSRIKDDAERLGVDDVLRDHQIQINRAKTAHMNRGPRKRILIPKNPDEKWRIN